MTTCPTCQRPVDPLRARAVGVRDGKVVAFCSPECAGAPSTASRDEAALARAALSRASRIAGEPVPGGAAGPPPGPRAAAGPPPGSGRVRAPAEAFDSGPVIEILHEPASGVVTSARDRRRSAAPDDDLDRAASSVDLHAPDDDDDDDDHEDEHEDGHDDKAGATAADASSGDEDEDPTAAATAAAASAATAVVRATSVEPARPSPADVPPPHRRNTGERRRDSIATRAGWEWLDEEPAEPVLPRARGRRGASRFWIAMLVLALLGGGGWAAYQYWYRDRLKRAPRPPAATGAPAASSPAPEVTPGAGSADPEHARVAAVDQAREVLRGHLAAASPRVQRLAAAALARTGDPDAIAALVGALDQETTELARLDIAYALARAGDSRGSDLLVATLGSPRRDAKLEAGRLLALLGDKRAAATLAGYLEVSQHRLSVAEHLEGARVGDARASADDRARAAIALGVAGRAEVAGELRALLTDPRFNAYAAAALATLRDATARPVLLRQLEVPSLRVAAARALRRLDPALDPAPLLAPLVGALAGGKDTEQIQIAEAVVLLAGPASWSERT